MNHKTYAEYKDSNVDWIGDIPLSWRLLKSKFIFSRINNQSTTGSEELLSVSEYYGVKPKKETIKEGEFISRSESLIGYKKCSKNDLVMNIMLAWKKGLGVTDYDGIVSPAYEIFNINTELSYPQYMNYLLRTDLFASEFKRHSYGVIDSRLRLYPDNFKEIECILPPLEEQKQIANYLDKKTSKIDTTIAKNKELIQLLEEKRTALINQVVTKGLNPEVPMKDSGIEWIGEIPEHWKTNKIKNMSYVKGRIGWHGLTSEEYSDEGAYLVTGTDFEEGTVDWNHCNHISYERYKQDPNIHLKEGDLLITKDGTIGKLALIKNIPDKATLNSGIFLVRPLKDNYTNEYLYWILSSDIFTRFFDYIKTGATIAHLYQETFERFFFPYMDINEQNKIVDFLNIHISKINFTIKKVEENINLLEEYKTSLIHHVVTGKIDVRGEEI